jgi:hypothetical protein
MWIELAPRIIITILAYGANNGELRIRNQDAGKKGGEEQSRNRVFPSELLFANSCSPTPVRQLLFAQLPFAKNPVSATSYLNS